MPLFSYRGRNSAGQMIEGQQEAGTADQVANWLNDRQITPINIEPSTQQAKTSGSLDLKDIRWLQRVSLDELILFSRQMYSLSRAGVPITRAIRGLAISVKNPMMQRTLNAIAEDLEQGVALSSSFNKHPKIFNRLYVSLLHVGENTGNLDTAFKEAGKYLELERETIKSIKAATRYPLFVISAIMVAIFIINIFVIPQFEGVFSKLGAELPWQTQVLISISTFMRDYWYLLIGGLVFGLAAFCHYINTPQGRFKWDRTKLHLPIVGGMFWRIALGRFCRAFSLVLRAGIPIEQGLSVVSGAVGNSFVGSKVQEMRQGIERGEGFGRTAQNTEMFSPLVLQMISVGEETGNIDDMLEQTAEFYEQEVQYDLKALTSTIEPILIIAIGGMVLVLALGVFLPLWELNATVNG